MLPLTNHALEQFRATLRDSDVVEAMNQFDSVETALQRQESQERMYQSVARGTIARTAPSERANNVAKQVVEQAFEAEQARLSFNIGFMSFAGGNLSPGQMADRADQVINSHNKVNSTAETLQEVKSGVALPRLLTLTGPRSVTSHKGGDLEVAYSVENFGTRPIENVVVSVEGGGFAPSPSDIGTLAADESETVTVSGTTGEAGTFDVDVSAEGDGVTETTDLTIRIIGKKGSINQALAVLEELQSHISAIDTGDDENGLMEKATTAEQRLKKIQARLERGRTPPEKAINNQINSVINLLNAFGNQVDGMTGSRLSEDQAALLLHDSREVIGVLNTAVSVDP